MLDFKELTLQAKQEIESCAKNVRVTSSELTFTTFFIYRKLLNVKYAIKDGMVIYKTKIGKGKEGYRFPLGDGDKTALISELIAENPNLLFYGLTSDMIDFLEQNFKDRFTFSKMENFDDYVYSWDKLANLTGKKLHSKRNHINNFYKLYQSEFSKITPEDKDLIISTYDRWFKETDDKFLLQEKEGIKDLLENYDKLGLVGGKLMVSGNLVAFSIGERLNDDTAVVHIEKADTNYKGAYTVINQQFAKNCLYGFTYINREEDMGLEGLRKAKMSYQPDFMVEKYKGELL